VLAFALLADECAQRVDSQQLSASDCDAGSRFSTAQCSVCEAGRYSAAAGAAECMPCDAGQYSEAGAAQCSNCGAGRYSAAEGAAECTDCDPGRYRDGGGATACGGECEAGKYLPQGATECMPCGAGQYSEAGAAQCSDCGAGRYSAAEAAECTDCDPGRYRDGGGAAECRECEAGKHSPQGATECSDCRPGHVAPDLGSASCSPCPAGQFWIKNRTSAHLSCSETLPAGSDCAVVSAGRKSYECSRCEPGQYGERVEQSGPNGLQDQVCKACQPGRYSSTAGQSVCMHCASKMLSSPASTGVQDCVSCATVGPCDSMGQTRDRDDRCVCNSDHYSTRYGYNDPADGRSPANDSSQIPVNDSASSLPGRESLVPQLPRQPQIGDSTRLGSENLTVFVRCHSSSTFFPTGQADNDGNPVLSVNLIAPGYKNGDCLPCDRCLDCSEEGSPPTIAAGWVRYFPKESSQLVPPHSMLVPAEGRRGGQLDDSVRNIIIVELYPCGDRPCGRNEPTALVAECIPNSTEGEWCCEGDSAGHLCHSCKVGYFWDPGVEDGKCVPCELTQNAILITVPLSLALIGSALNHPRVKVKLMVMVAFFRQFFEKGEQDGSYEGIQQVRALFRSCWQPIRIIISYSQVMAQVGQNLDISFPAEFQTLLEAVQTIFVFTNWLPNTQCALDGYVYDWIFSVVVVPGILLMVVCVDYFVNPKRVEFPTDARKDLLANLFAVVFFM
jgi:hypothetical protein